MPESYSGDGLIAASLDRRDEDLVATISYARARESLFGEVETELARSEEQRLEALRQLGILLNSTTFKIMQKYAPIIDRYFAEGTLRGCILSKAKKILSTHLG